MARRYDVQNGRQGLVSNYAKIIGSIILVIGVAGVLLSSERLLGVFNIDLVEDVIHLATGGLMAYVGFARPSTGVARSVVGALGVVYLLVGILGFGVPTLFGLLPTGYNLADNLLHLGLGVLGIVVGYVLARR